MRDLQRQHQRDAEKLIKEAEIREKEDQRREKAIEANQNVKGLTARDVYARKCLGTILLTYILQKTKPCSLKKLREN